MRPRPETTEVTQFASKAINLLNFDSEDKTLYLKPLMIENGQAYPRLPQDAVTHIVVDTQKFDSEDKTLYIKPLMIENVVDTHKLDSENKTLYLKPLTKGYGYISVTGR